MTTYSKLNNHDRFAFNYRLESANDKFSISFSFEDYAQLALEEHRLQRWAEDECNGTIQRDEETGKPYRWLGFGYGTTGEARYRVPDKEKGSLKRCKEIAARYGLKFFHQSDPRGCQVHVYKESDLNGSDIRSVYPTQAHAIYF